MLTVIGLLAFGKQALSSKCCLKIDTIKHIAMDKFPKIFLQHLKVAAYFSTTYKLLYVATPKVACTSLKWWLADLVGCSNKILDANVSFESDPELVIHDTFHQVALQMTGFNAAGLDLALTSPEYFKFCVIRNPFKRVFSAWQSKWLIHEPLQKSALYGAAISNKSIETIDDLRENFEDFIANLKRCKDVGIDDVHLIPQSELLRPDLINYDCVAKIEDLGDLKNRLSTHLGMDYSDPFAKVYANVSLLPYLTFYFSENTIKSILDIYAADFQLFGYEKILPTGRDSFNKEEAELAIKAVKLLSGRNERIGKLTQRIMLCKTAHEKPLVYDRHLSKNLVEVADLLKQNLANRDSIITYQRSQLQQMREELLRAEVQLDLLKDMLVDRFDSQIL